MRGIGFASAVLCVAGSLAGGPSWSAETTEAAQSQAANPAAEGSAEDLQILPPDEPVAASPAKGKPEGPSSELDAPSSEPQMSSLTSGSEGSDSDTDVISPKVNLPADLESDGAFRYRIGLSVPEFRGLVPDLGFRYSSSDHSRGDPGAVMGIGWSLAGLSSIERVSEHLGAPNWSATEDIFRLDGTELMACKDTGATNPWSFSGWAYPTAFHTAEPSASCAAGGNMAPQRENYLRILRVADDTSTTSRFEVTRPDGTVMIYRSVGELSGETGTTSDAYFDPAFRRLWLLSEIRDAQATANVVSLTYDFAARADGYAHRLRTITYGGYEVKFLYTTVTTPLATFSVGKTGLFGKQVNRLTAVTVKDGATQVRAYKLSYTSSALTGASLLSSVQEYGSNYTLSGSAITGGTALPATSFGYSADSYALTEQLYGSEHKFNSSSAVWDFDFDQRQDLVFSQENYASYEDGSGTVPAMTLPKGHYGFDAARAMQALPDGWIPVPSFYSTNSSAMRLVRGIWSSPGPEGGRFMLRLQADFSMQGENEVYSYQNYFEQISLTGTVLSSHAIGGATPDGYGAGPGPLFARLLPGERTQVVADKLYTIDSSGAPQVLLNAPTQLASFTPNADANGDGLSEAVIGGVGTQNGSAIKWFDGTSIVQTNGSIPSGTCGSAPLIGSPGRTFGDANGDGYDDLVVYDTRNNSTDRICVALSNGRSFGPYDIWANLPNYSNGLGPVSGTNLPLVTRVDDVNGDGLGDVIADMSIYGPYEVPLYDSGRYVPNHRIKVFLSKGSSFSTTSDATAQAYVAHGDFDGDGRADFASMKGTAVTGGMLGGGTYYTVGARIYWGPSSTPNLLTSITVPEGGTVAVSYRPSSDFAGNEVPGVSQVVDEIVRGDGRGQTRTTSYSYVGSRYDYERRKPLGFQTVSAQMEPIAGETAGPVIVTTYENDHPAEYGLVKSRTVTMDGTTTWEKKINDWDVAAVGNGPWRAVKSRERVSTRYGGQLVETMKEFTWTAFGQPATTIDYGFSVAGVDAAANDNSVTTIDYVPNLTGYIVDRPSTKRQQSGTTSSMDGASRLWMEFYHYDGAANHTTAPSRGNLSELRRWTGNPANLNSRFEAGFSHDAYGNVLTAQDANGNDTTYTYDSTKHLFRLTETNDLSQVVTTVWNTGCQAPATVTDANALATSFTYDVHCRETRRDFASGNWRTIAYLNWGNPTTAYVELSHPSGGVTGTTDVSVARSYFDGLGQNWRSTTSGAVEGQANYAVIGRGFDKRGNLDWESIPLSWAAAPAYNGAAATNQRTSFAYDPLGRVLSATAADGAVAATSYDLRTLSGVDFPMVTQDDAHCFDGDAATVCGEVRLVSDARGNAIRREMTDVNTTDVGATGSDRITSFDYDLLNRLTGVTDPIGATWAYSYDVYGNRTVSDDPALGLWTMSYDPNGNLELQTDAKGQTIAFTYDGLNRVLTKVVTTTGGSVTTTSTYDQPTTGEKNIGKLTTLANPSHTISYGYDANGKVTREAHTFLSRTYTLGSTYHLSGQLLSQSLPTTPGSTATASAGTWSYDAAGRPKGFGTRVTAITYDLWGNPTQTTYGNGAKDLRSYSATRGWLSQIELKNASNARIDLSAYTRSATGRISRMETHEAQGRYDFTYDYAGRMLSAVNYASQPGMNQTLTYDAAGSIRTNSRVGSYSYGAPSAAHPHAPTSVAGDSFTYDLNGNMLVGPPPSAGMTGRTSSYDGENRPASVVEGGLTTSYTYAADGSRLLRTDPAGKIVATFGAVEIRDLGGAGETVLTYPHPDVRLKNGTEVTWLHRDHLSSVRTMTNAAGARAAGQVYVPFGEQVQIGAPLDPEETKGFIGERYDSDAGLQYLNARYYDPRLAMFIQPDWFEVTEQGVGTNRYAYSGNDPVNLRDPGGNATDPQGDPGDDDEKENNKLAELDSKEVEGLVPDRTDPALDSSAKSQSGVQVVQEDPTKTGRRMRGADPRTVLPFGGGGAGAAPGASGYGGRGYNSPSSQSRSGTINEPNTTATGLPTSSPPGVGRGGAFNEAKRQNGIPTSQQPSRTTKNEDRRGNTQPGRTYEFDAPAPGGGTVRIRDDSRGHQYKDNPSQNRGPHFNDPKGRHYDY